MNCENDSKLFALLEQEEERQGEGITLIASENVAYPEVRAAMASVLGDKYAEGYPGKRYYAGCENVDQVELLAQERCKKLFNADHVNVQPHSGSNANMAVFFAAMKPGDTLMGMNLASGGHLTHGHKVSFSGMLYNIVTYDVNPESELIDYDEIERLAKKHRPKLIIAGASSYSRIIDYARFSALAKNVGALLLADCAHTVGLIAADLYPSPVPYADFVTATTHKTLRGPRGGFILCKEEWAESIDRAVFPGTQGGPFMDAIAGKAVAFHYALQDDFQKYQHQAVANAQAMVTVFKELGYRIVSDGTDTHLFVIDLQNKQITGKEAEQLLEQAGIYVSRSLVPFDPQKPTVTSGIRIGTLAITSRGCTPERAGEIALIIDKVLSK